MIFDQTLRSFIRKEFKQSLRDPNMKELIFVTPTILLLVFGFALVNETRNVRLAAKIAPDDAVFRQVYEHSLATGWFLPSTADPDGEPTDAIERGEAEAVLVAPPGGLTRAVARGDGRLQLLVSGADILRAQAIERYVAAISDEVAAGEAKVRRPRPPLRFDVRTLYNPSLSTAAFMLPGTIMLIILQITVIVTSCSISREKESGTFETMISAPLTRREIILGKTIPYIVLGMVNLPILVGMAHFVFHVPVRGSLAMLAFVTLVFVWVTVAVGAFIGTVSRNQQQSFMLSFLFIFPGTLMSGVFFPFENMPETLKMVAYCNPLTHYLPLIRNILLKGGEPSMVAWHLAVLVAMGLLFSGVSFRYMHTTLD